MTTTPIKTKVVLTFPDDLGKWTFSKIKNGATNESIYNTVMNLNNLQVATAKHVNKIEEVLLEDN